MEKRSNIKRGFFKLVSILFVSCFLIACNDEPDDYYARNNYELELTSSVKEIVLNENTPDDIALTLEWVPAADLGYDYILTYVYEADFVGKKPDGAADGIKEYEDDGIFKRSYTHKQLQELLIDDWKQLTSTTSTIQFTVTASYEGPTLQVPDVSITTVKVRTYGPLQFSADQLFISGTAVGEKDIEIFKSASNNQIYIYNGYLAEGTINFPVIFRDQNKENSIGPVTAQQDISDEAMAAEIKVKEQAGTWVVKEAGDYRVILNFANKTASFIPAGDILEFDKLYLAGNAVGSEDIELTQTLEDESIYAFRGNLNAGSLYLPMLFGEDKEFSIVPSGSGSQDIDDGNTVKFARTETTNASGSNYWNIKTAGTYRIVVDIDTKTITIYSSATDLQNATRSWNNTVIGKNPYVEEVTALWMWGQFNTRKGNTGWDNEFDTRYVLTQSLANPYVFVYKGDVLPRNSYTDEYDKKVYVGAVNFKVSKIHNNVWACGSTADAVRGSKNGYLTTSLGATQTIVEGQKDNRYAYFLIPENTNYVMVNLEKSIVVFDNRP